MTISRVLVQPDAAVSRFESTAKLETGGVWKFVFWTNTQDGGWFFDLYDASDNPLVLGLGLSVGVDLLYPYRYLDVPPGILWVEDVAQTGADPGLTAFADGDAILYYMDAAQASGGSSG